MKYNHHKIEKKWQEVWEKTGLYLTRDEVKGKENFYALVEFPYPSGNLHVGHWYAFCVPDIFARMRRMQGKNVLFPIGFDAFGLPAENAALKRGINPRKWTHENIDYMRKQLRTMGASFDWSREVITCDPEYYKWTQWIFLQFFKKGLAHQADSPVNWCPSCKTVLANEQVIGGQCERCESLVERRNMKQWQLRITDYAEKLLKGLDKLDWPEEIKESQRNWIGKSEGAEIEFRIKNYESRIKVFTTRPDTIFGATYIVVAPEHPIVAKLLAATPSFHSSPLEGEEWWGGIKNVEEVKQYIERAKRKTEIQRTVEEKEKTGIELKGIKAINPATKEEIPIWVADYVLMTYGTGAIMAVPAHDQRDFEFAKKYGLPIKQVVAPLTIPPDVPPKEGLPFVERTVIACIIRNPKNNKYLCLQWKAATNWKTFLTGGVEGGENMVEAAKREIVEETGYKNFKFVKKLDFEAHEKFYHLVKKENRYARLSGLVFDLIDEQRDKASEKERALHEVVWIPEKEVESFVVAEVFKYLFRMWRHGPEAYIGEGTMINSGKFNCLDSERAKWEITRFVKGVKKVQYKLRDWLISRQRYWGAPIPIIHCPYCGVQPVPEKDLPVKLPEIRDYKPRGDGKSPLAKEEKWVKVKCPRCRGPAERETDTMDTFIDSSWYFLRYLDPKNKKEFASEARMRRWMPVKRYSGGAEHTTMHLLYSRFWIRAMYDLGLLEWDEPYLLRMNRGLILGPDGQKMSKSRGNVVEPDNYVKLLGADTVRMYLAFIGPYNEVGAYPWNPKGIMGIRRFLEKVWRLFQNSKVKVKSQNEIQTLLHKTIKKVTEDIGAFKFNTAISAMMVLVNEISIKYHESSITVLETFLKLLAPFAPHLAEELWHELGHKKSIHLEKWPEYDERLTKEELVTIAVQVNGKLRATIKINLDATETEVRRLAEQDENVRRYLGGKRAKKVIYVQCKIINFVTD